MTPTEQHRQWVAKNRGHVAEYMRQWRAANRERHLQQTKEWREKNADKLRKVRIEYCKQNRERINKNWRHSYYKNRDARLARQREKYAANPEPIRASVRQWRQANPDKQREIRARHYRKHPSSVIGLRLRIRLWKLLNVRGLKKTVTFQSLIGCTPNELRAYLEKQFLEGMTWENYGSWHIDHIVPCAKFDISIVAEQRRCFHFSNLQPMWAFDNISKGARCPSL